MRIPRPRDWNWPVIGFILAMKVLIFTFAVQAVVTMAKNGNSGWMQIWNRWDAVHYFSLAQNGYVATGEGRFSLVFYPLYPALVYLAHFLTGDYLAATFFVSGLASIAAGLLLQRLALLDQSPEVARNSVWFLFIFPTSYFLHIGYTESLFLALTLGCFVAARLRQWLLAGFIGLFACMTRVNGLLLLPAIGWEVLEELRATRRISWRWLGLGLMPIGFLIYLAINHQVTGDYFAFSKIMEEHWYKKLTPPWIGIRDVWLRLDGDSVTEGLHELFYIVLTFVAIIVCGWRLRASYAIWMLCNWLLVNSTSFVVSVPRYALALFPIFILMAQACTGRRFWYSVVSVWCLLYLALYVGRFAQGLWAF